MTIAFNAERLRSAASKIGVLPVFTPAGDLTVSLDEESAVRLREYVRGDARAVELLSLPELNSGHLLLISQAVNRRRNQSAQERSRRETEAA